MARTYIFRHEPVLPGAGRKVALGVGGLAETKTRNEIFRQVSEILGTPLRLYPHWRWYWHRGSRVSITKEEWELFDRIEEITIFPIRSPWYNRARNAFPGIRAKTYYKQKANRLGRRKVRELLKSREIDYDEMLFPGASEYFDPWDFD
jgi:hypothetical protein